MSFSSAHATAASISAWPKPWRRNSGSTSRNEVCTTDSSTSGEIGPRLTFIAATMRPSDSATSSRSSEAAARLASARSASSWARSEFAPRACGLGPELEQLGGVLGAGIADVRCLSWHENSSCP